MKITATKIEDKAAGVEFNMDMIKGNLQEALRRVVVLEKEDFSKYSESEVALVKKNIDNMKTLSTKLLMSLD